MLARGHTKAVDYWAYGILLYEMEAGYSPFSDPQGMDQVVICKNIVNGRLVFPRNFNADCKVTKTRYFFRLTHLITVSLSIGLGEAIAFERGANSFGQFERWC